MPGYTQVGFLGSVLLMFSVGLVHRELEWGSLRKRKKKNLYCKISEQLQDGRCGK